MNLHFNQMGCLDTPETQDHQHARRTTCRIKRGFPELFEPELYSYCDYESAKGRNCKWPHPDDGHVGACQRGDLAMNCNPYRTATSKRACAGPVGFAARDVCNYDCRLARDASCMDMSQGYPMDHDLVNHNASQGCMPTAQMPENCMADCENMIHVADKESGLDTESEREISCDTINTFDHTTTAVTDCDNASFHIDNVNSNYFNEQDDYLSSAMLEERKQRLSMQQRRQRQDLRLLLEQQMALYKQQINRAGPNTDSGYDCIFD